jgi:probable F420-dependent oxidoreductase
MQLGKLGVWYPMDRLDAAGIRGLLGTVERLGYAALWYPESRGYESLSLAGFMLGNTSKLAIGSSIASIYARDAFTARRGMIGLSQLYGARFILGLGVSHMPMVEGIRGHTYGKPLAAMRAYLDALTRGEAGAADWPVVIAALGPKMLELAGQRTLGAIPYNTTPTHTAAARAKLPAGKWLAVEQKVSLETDPAKARALGRKELSRYLVLENYRNSWLGMGFTEQDLSDGGSDGFIDQMMLWGDAAAVKAGLRAHVAAGATHLCIQPVHDEGDTAARDKILAALAGT